MIWGVLFPDPKRVELPVRFNAETMQRFAGQVVDEQRDAQCGEVIFDFRRCEFIEPVGVVVLSNLIEFMRAAGCKVKFAGHTVSTPATQFLDGSGFFERYLKKKLFANSSLKESTVPLKLVSEQEAASYLRFDLMPWIGRMVGMRPESIDTIRACIEEILHNVRDHSGVKIGCTFAQFFPARKRLQLAISDFGSGIPNVVRTKLPAARDPAALRLACKEGFTTQSNVQNRGAGLPTLLNTVTIRNGGNVLIASGWGELSASPTLPIGTGYKITTREGPGFYPGTLVRVILRTDTIERFAEDVEPEDFQW